jgi:hypothetical protein
MSRKYSKHPPPKFRVGDLVRSRQVPDGPVYEIVEDHGNIGVGGRRILFLRTTTDDPDTFALPEESLELVTPRGQKGTDTKAARA